MYSCNYPFRHWIEDDAWSLLDVDGAAAAFPPAHWPHWIRYSGPSEFGKRTCETRAVIPDKLLAAIDFLQSAYFVARLCDLTGIPDLCVDPTLRGGGLHQTVRGGYLDAHLDYQYHPTLHLARRINAILFLSDWHSEWGGALEFWDAEGRGPVKSIEPQRGRLVLFECSDISYHGCPAPMTCPDNVTRNTVAVYYLSPPVGRKRALFVPRREKTVDDCRNKTGFDKSCSNG